MSSNHKKKQVRLALVGLLALSVLANVYLFLENQQYKKSQESLQEQTELLESALDVKSSEFADSLAVYHYVSSGVLSLIHKQAADSLQIAHPSPDSDSQLRWYEILQDYRAKQIQRTNLIASTQRKYAEASNKVSEFQALLFELYEKSHIQKLTLDSLAKIELQLNQDKLVLQYEIDSLATEIDVIANSFGSLDIKDPEGKTILFFGKIADGKANGRGVGVFPSKAVYKGEWANNLRHGYGTYYWTNGDTYEGEFVKGKRDGHGTYTFVSGEKYSGNWRNDVRDGKGTMYARDGKVILDGNWEADRFKKDNNKIETE
jgi:hypothetical protein